MDASGLPPVTVWLREQLRLGRARSRRQIAEYTKLSPDTVAKIFRGEVARPEPETIRALAEYFHESYDRLMVLAGYVGEVAAPAPQEQPQRSFELQPGEEDEIQFSDLSKVPPEDRPKLREAIRSLIKAFEEEEGKPER